MGDASPPDQAEHLQELPMVPGTPASAVASCAQTHALSCCPPSATLHCWFWQAGLGTNSFPGEDSIEA